MDITTQVPLDNPQQVSQWLQSMLPSYTYTVRGSFVTVGNGSATGVLIRPMGPGRARLQWAFPSMGLQMLLGISIPLTGILPGLLLYGLVWLTVSGGVGALKQDIARVLAGGAGAPAMAGAMPMAPASSGGGAGKAFGVVFLLIAMLSGAFAAYSYYEYDRLGSYSYGSYRSTYGRYGSYGSGYDYTYWRRREHKERFQAAGAASALFFLLGIVLVARKGASAPMGAQPGGYPMQPAGYPQQGGYPMQQGYPQQPMQQGYPSNPGYAPQQPVQQGYPSNPGYAPQQPMQQGYPQGYPSNPGYAPQQPVQQGYPSNPGYAQPPQGGWPGGQGGPGAPQG